MGTKESQLQIRVTSAEKAAIRSAAQRAGMEVSTWVLARVLPQPGRAFRELLQQLVQNPAQRRFTLAALNDLLTGTPAAAFADMVSEPPSVSWDEWTANYVAAMVETAAHGHRLDPPPWAATIAPLDQPAFGSPLPRLRLHLLLASPPAFKRRNLFVDSTLGDRV
jgi:uncharacterized protein (DUF1778 family)